MKSTPGYGYLWWFTVAVCILTGIVMAVRGITLQQ